MNNLSNIIKVLIFSSVAYMILFIIAKILGKKQIAQLSFVDYIVGISIGSIAAEMATDTENPFYHYIIAMAIFFLFDLLVSIISRKGKLLKKIFCGKPLIIINNGQIIYKELKKSKLTLNEVLGMAREKNFFDINEIAFGILETSGKLSILPKSANKPPICKDLGIDLPQSTLTSYYIIDGTIAYDVLKTDGKTKEWLLNGINVQNEKDIDNILLASFDEQKGKFDIQYKSA